MRTSKTLRIIWWRSSRSTEITIPRRKKCLSNWLKRTTISSFWKGATVSNQRPKQKLKLKCPCRYQCSIIQTTWAPQRVTSRLSLQDMPKVDHLCFHQVRAPQKEWLIIPNRFHYKLAKWGVQEVWTPRSHHARYQEYHRFRWRIQDHRMSLLTINSNNMVIPRQYNNFSLLTLTLDLGAKIWFLNKILCTIKTWVIISILMVANITMISTP